MRYAQYLAGALALWALLFGAAAQAQTSSEWFKETQDEIQRTLSKARSQTDARIEELRKETREDLRRWIRHGNTPPAEEGSPSEPSSKKASSPEGAEGEGRAPVPSERRRRASPYRELIERFARRRGLPQSLLFALADAESFFRPEAKSNAGAIGLLQVHPPTGGRVAHKALHGTSRVPKRSSLEDPAYNVRLGTKLLDLLLERYFGGVRSPWSRQLLAVAAYNCGAGRLAGGLTGDGSVKAAVEWANAASPRDVYERIRRTAPSETRVYVRRVFERRQYYARWASENERVYGVPPEK